MADGKEVEVMLNIGYAGAVVVFALGVITSVITVVYIVKNYMDAKDKDPFEGE